MIAVLKPIPDGILTGLFLQLAIGPVFFFILSITIESNYKNALFAIIAVTIVDYLYIALSLFGIGQFINKPKPKPKQILGLFSSLIIMLFGAFILYKALWGASNDISSSFSVWTPMVSFTSAFFLTLSSPLTIVFWTGIFSTKAIEKNYSGQQLLAFGLGAGAATFVFLALTMFILFSLKTSIPSLVIKILNSVVGIVLIYYGLRGSYRHLSGKFNHLKK